MEQSNKVTAIYCRTAHRDMDGVAIERQKQELQRFALENGYSNIALYIDDGFSGLSFDRPSFKKIERQIANGEIGTLIVKDISRIGRNSLDVIKWIWEVTEQNVSVVSVNQPGLPATETCTDFLLAAALKGGEQE